VRLPANAHADPGTCLIEVHCRVAGTGVDGLAVSRALDGTPFRSDPDADKGCDR
jgi:hypothetical protein